MKLFTDLFRQPTADAVRKEQLADAERMRLEHLAAAEMHAGLAGVYGARIERLRREMAGATVTPMRGAR